MLMALLDQLEVIILLVTNVLAYRSSPPPPGGFIRMVRGLRELRKDA